MMALEGEVRGIGIKGDWEYILQTQGEQELKKVEQRMAELGYPLKYKDIRGMDFYPIGYDLLSMSVIKEVFDFDDKDMERLGSSAPKFSILLKVLMKYFASAEMVLKEAPKTWHEYYTTGDLEIAEFNKKQKYTVLRIKNFKTHPIHCPVLKGYFSKVLEMVVSSSVRSKETKCVFKGDPFHQFLFKWS